MFSIAFDNGPHDRHHCGECVLDIGRRHSVPFQQLRRITELVDSGTIRPVVGATVPFDQASHALRSLGRGVRGKTVVTLPHH
nr:zinc-binding dehydrogenase [Rhodococcus sp. 15-1154-1]